MPHSRSEPSAATGASISRKGPSDEALTSASASARVERVLWK